MTARLWFTPFVFALGALVPVAVPVQRSPQPVAQPAAQDGAATTSSTIKWSWP